MMRVSHIDKTYKGWFVGNFDNAVTKTPNCEVCYKKFPKDYVPELHHHRKLSETSIVISGRVKLHVYKVYWDNERRKIMEPLAIKEFGPGDIWTIEPFESVALYPLEDVEVVTVKLPSVLGDKYLDV
jgi:mannose-6-phosphate isomerase-like protein (cupin superfamily)